MPAAEQNAGNLYDGRFARIERMIGSDGLARLAESFVVVVGLGAVGSYATEALARAGIGKLRLVDFDEVRLSNINRQLYALDSTVGRKKAQLACERVRQIKKAGVLCAVSAIPQKARRYGAIAQEAGCDLFVVQSTVSTVKLTRAMWIMPVVFGAALLKKSNKRAHVPLFIIGFIAAAAVRTILPVYEVQWNQVAALSPIVGARSSPADSLAPNAITRA